MKYVHSLLTSILEWPINWFIEFVFCQWFFAFDPNLFVSWRFNSCKISIEEMRKIDKINVAVHFIDSPPTIQNASCLGSISTSDSFKCGATEYRLLIMMRFISLQISAALKRCFSSSDNFTSESYSRLETKTKRNHIENCNELLIVWIWTIYYLKPWY